MSTVSRTIVYVLCILIFTVGIFLSVRESNNTMIHSQNFIINGGTFNLDAYVIITDDTDAAVKFANDTLDQEYTKDDFKAGGLTLCDDLCTTFVVWLPVNSSKNTSIVHHELVHLTYAILHAVGIELSPETDEVYAYELQHLSEQFYKQLNQ
jgi:hypothetical protein